ncbi:MAG: ABC transporter ATP-binding protein [Granulosicoccus sp.]
MNAPVLEVTDLCTEFTTREGTLVAVNNVSFSLRRGEILGLVGESGSGKSVTGFSLLGLVDAPGKVVSGSIRLNGTELVGLSDSELRKRRGREIAMIFQDPIATLNPLLSIRQQMLMALSAHQSLGARAAENRCVEVLQQVGIPEALSRLNAYPHEFSGGMRQRVAIAIALLHGPAVLVADEPTTALDVSIQAQILQQMRQLAADTGTAMIWISHDLATVSSIAQTLYVMYAGRIVEQGPAKSVLRQPRHPYTQGLIDSLPGQLLAGETLQQIPGSTPSLLSLPPGCAFAPRCSSATVNCNRQPEVQHIDKRRWRCHHPLTVA